MTGSDTRYRLPARLLHWAMAIVVLGMVPAGFVMVQPGLDRALQNTLFIFHKNAGVVMLVLILVRIVYRLRHPPAPLPSELPDWQRRIAGASHGLLYGLLLVMPIAGYVRVKAGGFPIEMLDAVGAPSLVARSDALAGIAKSIHYYGGIAIACLVALHVAAALHHGFVRKDGIVARMWPPLGGTGR